MKTPVKLFCLPFAGGNRFSYRGLKDKAPDSLSVITLEYPGRGARIREPLIDDIHALVNDMLERITNHIDQHTTYALYGHSMGGLVAYLIARKLTGKHFNAPAHLFVSGTSGPSAASRRAKKLHLRGRNEFFRELKELNGLPDEVMEDQDLLDLFEPILRADIKTCDNYYHQENGRLTIPVTVITGSEEDIAKEDIMLWGKETSAQTEFIQLQGNHFFIQEHPQMLAQIIARKLVHAKAFQSS